MIKKIKSHLLKKDSGINEMFTGMIPVFYAVFFILMFATLSIFFVEKEKIQDELVMASLGALQADVSEYGKSGRVLITDTGKSYATFQEILQNNMNLNSDFTPKAKGLIEGPVQIKTFIIYNNEIGSFSVYNLTTHSSTSVPGATVTAPNGDMVNQTSIYVEITFPYKLFGVSQTALINNLTSIKKIGG